MIKNNFTKIVIFCLSFLIFTQFSYAASTYPIVYNKNFDTTFDKLSIDAKTAKISDKPIGDIMAWVGLQLLGKPYSGGLLDRHRPEYLYISLDDTDCMLFAEELLATSRLIKQNKFTKANFTDEIEKIRYHGPLAYCNRNHYFKDWASENIKQGYLVDVAYPLTHQVYPYKAQVLSTYLQQNIAKVPEAKDVTCIKQRENYINEHEQIGIIYRKDIPKYSKYIKSGDIIGIVREQKGRFDGVHHVTIAYVKNHQLGIIHASSMHHKVIEVGSLTDYLDQFKDSVGILVLRPQ